MVPPFQRVFQKQVGRIHSFIVVIIWVGIVAEAVAIKVSKFIRMQWEDVIFIQDAVFVEITIIEVGRDIRSAKAG